MVAPNLTLQEKLLKDRLNEDCIFLYSEEGNWYAYESSAFYCHSLFRNAHPEWIPDPVYPYKRILRVRVPDPQDSPVAPLLQYMRKTNAEIIVSCQISRRGFNFWREQQRYQTDLVHTSDYPDNSEIDLGRAAIV